MMRRLPIGLLAFCALIVFSGAAIAAHGTTVVSPDRGHGWDFLVETGTTATGQFVSGPGTTPMGIGSANLTTSVNSDGIVLGVAGYQGVRLADIDNLEYSTYRSAGGPALAISLQFNIDNDLNDADDRWKGRLVFEPYYTETVLTGAWQTWDPRADTGAGNWWGTAAAISSACPMSNPCTWDEVLASFPDAGIHNVFGAVLFKAGSGWGTFDGNVDAFTIGINGSNHVYDFEPGKAACKNGGWLNSVNPNFKNQGNCVSYMVQN